MHAVVLADTHLETRPGQGRRGNPVRGRWLPPSALGHLERADVILHAGDVLDDGVLVRLRELAPVHAVLGNNDRTLVGALPEIARLDLGGVAVAMVHDAGARVGRAARMARRFPDAAVVVFGHSHVPCDELGIDGQLLFNPGSPTQRRAQPHHTLGVLELVDGEVVAHRIVELD
ncbi:MAG TPA: metallophosphoesterase family protein [Acidimicrobiales bacterium]|nr:metallophosphoesterase family protein [Acidimicrobiales bacterium]